MVHGPLDFGLVGILASLTTALAQNGISVFAVSTFDTDYILVKKDKAEAAVKAWEAISQFQVKVNV
ncbi:ACT domain-containing protein [Obelidium mucronatum]|nr:ACT domain-containing protein [Obelidium mucronatum]